MKEAYENRPQIVQQKFVESIAECVLFQSNHANIQNLNEKKKKALNIPHDFWEFPRL